MSESERSAVSPVAEILAGMVHDIRQPLTALRLDLGGAIQLLERDPPAVREALGAVRDALEDADRLEETLAVFRADGRQG